MDEENFCDSSSFFSISFLALTKIVASTIETLASFQRVFMFLPPVEPDYRSPGVSEAERCSFSVVFSGKKQPEQIGKLPEIRKNSVLKW